MIFIVKNRQAYKDSGITSSIILELSNLVLVDYNWDDEYTFVGKYKDFTYGNKFITVKNEQLEDSLTNKIKVGNVRLTKDGQKLYDIVEKNTNDKILEYIVSKWSLRGYKVFINNKIMN